MSLLSGTERLPEQMTVTIREDLHLSQNEVANSNIIALVAT
jgi:hypothetical protein